jgi:hypothetical protein
MVLIPCPYLNADVDLTDQRQAHIQRRHRDLLPAHRGLLIETITDPDMVLRSRRAPGALILCRWFPHLLGGKYVAAVIAGDEPSARRWLVTAYISRKLVSGEPIWQKN